MCMIAEHIKTGLYILRQKTVKDMAIQEFYGHRICLKMNLFLAQLSDRLQPQVLVLSQKNTTCSRIRLLTSLRQDITLC